MIQSALTINLVEGATDAPAIVHRDLLAGCKLARGLGFDGVEVAVAAPGSIDPGRLRILLNDHGLGLAAIDTSAGWTRQGLHLAHPEARARASAFDYLRGMIDFGGPLHAPIVVAAMQGKGGPSSPHATALGYLADGLERLADHAAGHASTVLFKPANRYETDLVNTLDSGVKLLRSLSARNVKLVADCFHMNIEEVDPAEAIRGAGRWLGLVHFNDSNRRAAGLGHFDHAPMAQALHEVGFDGYASAEAYPYPTPADAAESSIHSFRRFFRPRPGHSS